MRLVAKLIATKRHKKLKIILCIMCLFAASLLIKNFIIPCVLRSSSGNILLFLFSVSSESSVALNNGNGAMHRFLFALISVNSRYIKKSPCFEEESIGSKQEQYNSVYLIH
jgi:hypothetical protein